VRGQSAEAALVAALAEIAAPREENERLRGLLGLTEERTRIRRRRGNHATPRLIRCYVEELDALHLPRGLLEAARGVIESGGSHFVMDDRRNASPTVEFSSAITLMPVQESAIDALRCHDHAVLVAPTGSGKTVIACALIAAHRVPTLILVDRTPLVEQRKTRLMEHLGLGRRQVGRVAASAKASGIVDIATLQAIARRTDPAALFNGYGMVIVDECHHLPARSFELAVRDARARRWVGLTATPYRRDGLESIITMQCGPIRHEITLADTPAANLTRRLHVHETCCTAGSGETAAIQDVFRALVEDEARTCQIASDVSSAVRDGRNVLVLTQWTEHLDALAATLESDGLAPLVLKGGLGKKARAAVIDRLNTEDGPSGQLLLATGSYLGEGFDSPSLDTLFLAFPLAFKGRVVQYIGRILRATDTKTDVEVRDYVDPGLVFRKMHSKRLATYATLGFDTAARARMR
jgi:superfamily II DNA or RNA helicase